MYRSLPIGRRAVLAAMALAPLLARAALPLRAQTDGEFSVELLTILRGVDSPWGVALDAEGFVYLTDSRLGRVIRMAADGSDSQVIVSGGTGEGRVRRPQGLAVSGAGELYVVDGGNRRVQVFGLDGGFRRAWGSRGSAPGEFNAPRGIAVDADGFVYVADGFNDRIQKFMPDGTFVTTWGDRGGAPGQFSTPTGVAVGPSGSVYVADTFRDRVQVFSADGALIRVLVAAPDLRNPIGIAVDLAERVYVSEDVDHRVQVFDQDGAPIGRFGSEGTAAGRFQFPRGLAVDAAGSIYVADSFNHRVQVFASSLPPLAPPPEAADLSVGVALLAPFGSPLAHNVVDWRVRLNGRLWTVEFRTYYDATGGLARWGWPISDPLREDEVTVSQYFQRGVMDWAGDGKGGHQIYPRPVWDFLGGGRGGAPDLGIEPDIRSDQPGEIVGTWDHRVSNFAIDGTLVGFKDFFDALGGQAQFGAPRTEARLDTGEPGTVFDPDSSRDMIRQYFQNTVFEYAPAQDPPVRLRLLGDTLRNRRYAGGAWQQLAPFSDAAPVSVGDQTEIPRIDA